MLQGQDGPGRDRAVTAQGVGQLNTLGPGDGDSPGGGAYGPTRGCVTDPPPHPRTAVGTRLPCERSAWRATRVLQARAAQKKPA